MTMAKDTKAAKGSVLSFLGRRADSDFDIQAGSRGLSASEIVDTYLRTPGHFLSILRFFTEETVEAVAGKTGIPAATLLEYEKGQSAPPLNHLVIISKHYNAELRVLLEVFGHIDKNASKTSMGLAAKFDGELTPDEKLDLKAFMKQFSGK